jgi:hypothetical protein
MRETPTTPDPQSDPTAMISSGESEPWGETSVLEAGVASRPARGSTTVSMAASEPGPRSASGGSSRKGWRLGLLAVAGVLIAAWYVGRGLHGQRPPDPSDALTSTPDRDHAPQLDVTLLACTADPSGAHATGAVVNHSRATATYVVALSVVDDQGETVTSHQAVIPNVGAGDRVPFVATMPAQASSAPRATCRVASVDRYPAATR